MYAFIIVVMSQLNTLQFTEVNSKRLSDTGPISQRSHSQVLSTARQMRRDSIVSTEKQYRAMEKNAELQENIRENRLNCLFLRRKENLKTVSRANQDIFLRIQAQKSQYALNRLRNEYRKANKISSMISKHGGGGTAARPKTSISRIPLAPITPLANMDELDRNLKSR